MALVALDIGATKLALRLKNGLTLLDHTYRYDEDPDFENQLKRALYPIKQQVLADNIHLSCISIACAPTLGDNGEITRWPNRPTSIGVLLYDMLRTELGCDTVLSEDDGNAAALAEAAAHQADNIVYLGIGTGIGGGIILDGSIHRGSHKLAGEIGHIPVANVSGCCTCGRQYCLQSVASGKVLGEVLQHCDTQTLQQQLRTALHTNIESLNHNERKVYTAVDALAQMTMILSELLDPESIIIGGGVIARAPWILGYVTETAKQYLRNGQPAPNIVPAKLGHLSSLEGAVLLAERYVNAS